MPLAKTVVIYPDARLRKISEPYTDEELADPAKIKELVRVMFEVQTERRGVGISAIQIGVAKRVLIAEGLVMVNPTLLSSSAAYTLENEGCLSIPRVFQKVKRPAAIRVAYHDLNDGPATAELTSFAARVTQHELDHLDGKLFIDHLSSLRWLQLQKQHPQLPAYAKR